MGAITSHHGIDRNRASAASRFTRWVVPDRGSPTTMTGGSSSTSDASGWRAQEFLEAQSRLQQPDRAIAHDVAAQSRQPGVRIQRRHHRRQPIHQGVVAEIGQSGGLRGLGHHAVDIEIYSHRQSQLVHRLLRGGAPGFSQVPDPHLFHVRRLPLPVVEIIVMR